MRESLDERLDQLRFGDHAEAIIRRAVFVTTGSMDREAG